jgi:3',5'-cyclic AMP phosphodiesterase CpdA
MGNGRLTICQISDIHCGNAYFIPELLDRSIIEINRANPTVVVVSGDLTDAGYREEFEQAAEYIARIECENVMVIPATTTRATWATSTSSGSSGASVAHGSRRRDLGGGGFLGAGPQRRAGGPGALRVHRRGFLRCPGQAQVFVVHHHLIPLPGTGRERNIIFDAGDVLERLVEARVDLVLSGTSTSRTPGGWRTC